ncbi:PDxFFG protein [Mycoplasma sp. CSL10166]|uniref:PDxFFG protein n=1 Tax=Mycoplasma sp. CSL10166 TaxID=2813825 RepID=UPI00197C40C5|nr:PDxFFG protein [Mycoplasma sp. CSL10166]MBN4084332.1 PDxFFG protein [Mycoplasma sp. CSL10166]
MKKRRLNLKSKILLSFGIIGIGSAISIASMFSYANNSDEVNGSYSYISSKELKNDYSAIYDENKNLKPEIVILDPLKKNIVAKSNENQTLFWFTNEANTKYGFDDFYNEYFEKYKESFILEVKYGSFSFYDEYVLAVKPQKFVQFTKWFINNVSWGPDLLTLESFRIVPGVEENGNAITLGSHSTIHKEVSEIKFFPDAFFGSMPIYSIKSGPGNASDSLTYSLFKELTTKQNVDEYLKSIPEASAIKNSKLQNGNDTFLSLIGPKRLIGKRFLVYNPKNLGSNNSSKFVVLPFEYTEKQFNNDFNSNSFDSELHFNDFQEATIEDIVTSKDRNQNNKLFLNITFNFGNRKETINLNEDMNNKNFEVTYQTFESAISNSLIHFLDFYDVKMYENKKIIKFIDSQKNIYFFSSKIEAYNKLKEFKDLNNIKEEDRNSLKEFIVNKIDVKNGIITFSLNDSNNNIEKITFNSKSISDEYLQNLNKQYKNKNINKINYEKLKNNYFKLKKEFNNLKFALKYNGAITPRSLTAGPEDVSLLDKNGKPIGGLESRRYQVYNDVYSDLIDKVIEKYPQLLKTQNGPHIVKKLNDKGYYEYQLEDGEYQGFSESDRIGIPLILGASFDDFQGISTDFLKYVATHEYGHHFTLDQSQALNEKGNAVIVGGLSTRGGLNESSYYSIEALKNYLYARTHLDVSRVNALGTNAEKGAFFKFIFGKKQDDGTYKYEEKETENQIWGNKNNGENIYKTLENPERRFLQDFEGLQNASKIRKNDLGDLFIANSFDENSGTLNPYITGKAKAFKSKNDQQPNNTYEEISILKIAKDLKDGLGNNYLDFMTINNNDSINLRIVELTQKNNQIIATKINLFNEDGTPLINVKLNEPLDQESIRFINEKTRIIQRSILNSIISNYSETGWNNEETFLGGEIKSYFKTLFGYKDDSGLYNSIKYRNNLIEINPQTNGYRPDSGRKSFEYTSINEGQNNAKTLIQYIITSNNLSNARVSQGLVGNILAYVKDNKITKSYSFPYVNDSNFLSSQFGYINALNTYKDQFGISQISGFIQTNPIFTLLRTGTGLLTTRNNQTNPVILFTNSQNKVATSQEILDALRNQNNEKLYELTNKLIFNTQKKDSTQLLYNSFSTNQNKVTINDVETISFDSFEKLWEFSSIDYSKAQLESVTINDKGIEESHFNWNIDYVKTKFDLNTFKNKISSSENDPLKNIISTYSEQQLANIAMFRFRHSNYFMAVKDFNPINNLIENQAIFSKEYGIVISNNNFREGLTFNKQDPHFIDNESKFSINDIQDALKKYVKKILNTNEDDQNIYNSINSQDLYKFIGNLIIWEGNGSYQSYALNQVLFVNFLNGEPTSDVINYNLSRVEALLSDKFTDYVYNLAETLTRDYVQTTYVPNYKDFENLPKYLKGLNEATSGLDYIVDSTELSVWNDKKNNQENINNGVLEAVRALKYREINKKTAQINSKYQDNLNQKHLNILKIQNQIKQIQNEIEQIKQNDDLTDVQVQKIKELSEQNDSNENKLSVLRKEFSDILNKLNNEISNIKKTALGDFSNENIISSNEQRNSSYFGQFSVKSNGFFKDRWQKTKIGMELYDDNGEEIIDNTIRLKDFNGQKINSRARAFFISQLLNYGIGKRNVSGIFRNKRKDALALYGYLDNQTASKIDRIQFIDKETGEARTLKVNIKDTNNIFYLTKQGDSNSKHTLNDEGYSTWISDYALMGKYRDTLLKPKHQYYAYFIDSEGKKVSNINLGDLEYIAENGKTFDQASIKLIKEENTNETLISVDYQFNITG